MKIIALSILTAALAAATAFGQARNPDFPIIPYPSSLQAGSGSLTLAADAEIATDNPAFAPIAQVVSNDLLVLFGKRLAPRHGSGKAGDIVLKVDATLAGEAYRYDCGPDRVEIRAGSYQGMINGTTTLIQLAAAAGATPAFRRVTISDAPESGYRAMMIDMARAYHSAEALRRMVVYARLSKVNNLHLHFADDQAFTFPIIGVPGIPDVGLDVNNWKGKDGNQMKSLTRQEWIDLVAFAKRNGVNLVPEVELPGHSRALERADKPLFHFSTWGNVINIADPKVQEVCRKIITEIDKVFDSPYIFLGGDEADYYPMAYGRTRCGKDSVVCVTDMVMRKQWDDYMDSLDARFRREGTLGANQTWRQPSEVGHDFIEKMHQHIKSLGRKTLLWEGYNPYYHKVKLSKDIIFFPFDVGANPQEAYITPGHSVVNSAFTPLYVVLWSWPDTAVQKNGFYNTDVIYAWNKLQFAGSRHCGAQVETCPMPAYKVVPEASASKVLGASLCFWENPEANNSALMRTRLPAMSEKLWNRKLGFAYSDLQARLAVTEPAYPKLLQASALPLPAMAGTVRLAAGKGPGPRGRAVMARETSPHFGRKGTGPDGAASATFRSDGKRNTRRALQP